MTVGAKSNGRERRGHTIACPYTACILNFTEAAITRRVESGYAGAALIADAAILPRCEK